MLGGGHSGGGTAGSIPRCASQYLRNGLSLCEAMCSAGWMRRGTRRTQPPLWAHCCLWKHSGVLGLVGFTGSVPA